MYAPFVLLWMFKNTNYARLQYILFTILFAQSSTHLTVLEVFGKTNATQEAAFAWRVQKSLVDSSPSIRLSRLTFQQNVDFQKTRLFLRLTKPRNHKVSIFFLAFLPQFADQSRGPISLQLLLLGGVFIIATILVFGSIALRAGTLGLWLNRSSRAQNIMNRGAGAVFVCLVLRLATTEQ
jgi:hypothetical protein